MWCLMAIPLFKYTLLVGSLLDVALGCNAWVLSALTTKLLLRATSKSIFVALAIRVSISIKNVESAPCWVKFPISSLLKVHNTFIEFSFCDWIKLRNAGYTLAKSSSLGAKINSSCSPTFLDLSRL